MAHELDFNTAGEARMVSLNVNPWHALGRVVHTEMTDADLLREAKLDWTVEEHAVHDPEGKPIEGYKLLRRSEDKKNYTVVSDGYRTFQNTELVTLMREISFKTPLVWETAGCLHHGKTVWAMARLPELKIGVHGDETLPYMLLSNGHGNNRPLTIMPTAVRTVCANTLRMAQGGRALEVVRSNNVKAGVFDRMASAQGYSIKHTGKLDETLTDVINAYKHIIDDVRATQEAFERLTRVRVTPVLLQAYWDSVFGGRPDAEQVTVLQKYTDRDAELRRIYTSPTCMAGNGTLYAAYQAATEFVDHGKLPQKRRAAASEAGLAYAMAGAGWDLKSDAFDKALALAVGA